MSAQHESVSESGTAAVLCPECTTTLSGKAVEALRTIASDHNEQRHGGERVARTVRPKRNHIEAFLNRVARQYDAATADDLRRRMDDVAPWDEIGDREEIDG